MKRISTILLVLVLILTLAMAAGCDADVTTGDDNTATLILEGETNYTVSLDALSGESLADLLSYLIDSVGMLVMYDLDDGTTLTGLNNTISITGDALYIYTSNTNDIDSPAVTTTIEGVTVGITTKTPTKITLTSGCVIYATTTPPTTEDSDPATATLIIGGDTLTTYTVELDELTDSTAIALLNYLVSAEDMHLSTNDSGYGAYITEIGALAEDTTTGTYIYVYTSVESDKDTSAWGTSLEIEGTTVYSSGLGISSMSLTDGCVIYIATITY